MVEELHALSSLRLPLIQTKDIVVSYDLFSSTVGLIF